MSATPSHSFPKAEKLKSRKQIDLLFREGKSFFAAPVKCYYRVEGREAEIRNTKFEIRNGEEDLRFTIYDLRLGEEAEGKRNPEPELNSFPEGVAGETDTKDEKFLADRGGPESKIRNTKFEIRNGDRQWVGVKAGFSASKKQFKKSVDRNRIKRLMREAYRLHKHKLMVLSEEQAISLEVFFVFTDRSLPTFDLVEEKMKYCLRRLGKIVGGTV
jgi:ribonuclease P protein component